MISTRPPIVIARAHNSGANGGRVFRFVGNIKDLVFNLKDNQLFTGVLSLVIEYPPDEGGQICHMLDELQNERANDYLITDQSVSASFHALPLYINKAKYIHPRLSSRKVILGIQQQPAVQPHVSTDMAKESLNIQKLATMIEARCREGVYRGPNYKCANTGKFIAPHVMEGSPHVDVMDADTPDILRYRLDRFTQVSQVMNFIEYDGEIPREPGPAHDHVTVRDVREAVYE